MGLPTIYLYILELNIIKCYPNYRGDRYKLSDMTINYIIKYQQHTSHEADYVHRS